MMTARAGPYARYAALAALAVNCSAFSCASVAAPCPHGQFPAASLELQCLPQSEARSESGRIFGVVPTYSITDARNLPPLTSGEKFRLFAKGTLDPFPFVAYAAQAGVEQARDVYSGYGQGAAGYARRFGAALGDGTSARFFSTYVFPSVLRQDPRYFRKGEGSGWKRAGYCMTRAFLTRGDSGRTQPNWSNIMGKFTAAGLSNLYHPPEDRGASLTLTRVAISLTYQMLGKIAIEFWPDIHRRIFRPKPAADPGSEAESAAGEHLR